MAGNGFRDPLRSERRLPPQTKRFFSSQPNSSMRPNPTNLETTVPGSTFSSVPRSFHPHEAPDPPTRAVPERGGDGKKAQAGCFGFSGQHGFLISAVLLLMLGSVLVSGACCKPSKLATHYTI